MARSIVHRNADATKANNAGNDGSTAGVPRLHLATKRVRQKFDYQCTLPSQPYNHHTLIGKKKA